MELIGYLDSPFVRRVAITMQFLDIPYEHRELSIFRNYEEFRAINPMVKVPTLVLDDGEVLIDSGLIIDYLESQVASRSLMPVDKEQYRDALQFIGTALIVMEKRAQLIYETGQRPQEKQHGPWIERLQQQLTGALEILESMVAARAENGCYWLQGDQPGQADITAAVAWRFIMHHENGLIDENDHPALVALSARAEALAEFLACPVT
jgi:glutathione S-transferase